MCEEVAWGVGALPPPLEGVRALKEGGGRGGAALGRRNAPHRGPHAPTRTHTQRSTPPHFPPPTPSHRSENAIGAKGAAALSPALSGLTRLAELYLG